MRGAIYFEVIPGLEVDAAAFRTMVEIIEWGLDLHYELLTFYKCAECKLIEALQGDSWGLRGRGYDAVALDLRLLLRARIDLQSHPKFPAAMDTFRVTGRLSPKPQPQRAKPNVQSPKPKPTLSPSLTPRPFPDHDRYTHAR